MSRQDVEVVTRFFEALVAGPESAARFAHQDVVYVEDPRWPGADTYRGLAAVSDCWSKYDEFLGEAVTLSVEEVRDAGDQVVVIVRVAGRSRGVDAPYDHVWGYVCRTKGERLCYFRAYFDPDEALEAAG